LPIPWTSLSPDLARWWALGNTSPIGILGDFVAFLLSSIFLNELLIRRDLERQALYRMPSDKYSALENNLSEPLAASSHTNGQDSVGVMASDIHDDQFGRLVTALPSPADNDEKVNQFGPVQTNVVDLDLTKKQKSEMAWRRFLYYLLKSCEIVLIVAVFFSGVHFYALINFLISCSSQTAVLLVFFLQTFAPSLISLGYLVLTLFLLFSDDPHVDNADIALSNIHSAESVSNVELKDDDDTDQPKWASSRSAFSYSATSPSLALDALSFDDSATIPTKSFVSSINRHWRILQIYNTVVLTLLMLFQIPYFKGSAASSPSSYATWTLDQIIGVVKVDDLASNSYNTNSLFAVLHPIIIFALLEILLRFRTLGASILWYLPIVN
jgi:hypothetical protein